MESSVAESSKRAARRHWSVAVSVLVIGAVVSGAGWSLAPADEKNQFILEPRLPDTMCTRVGIASSAQMDALSPAGYSEQMRETKAVGASRIRLGAIWSEIEPVRGQRDWSALDMRVKAAVDAGLTPLLLLYGEPDWVDLGDKSKSADNAEAFGEFAADVAKRYGGSVDGYEIWNEPNLSRFWTDPSPENYMLYLRAAYRKIHAVRSDATVMSGGLAPASTTSNTVAPYEFLDRLYKAGAKDVTDAVAMHPYTFPETSSGGSDWNPFRIMERIRALMVSAGDPDKPFWLTEYGAPTGGEGGVSASRQAQMYEQALEDVSKDPEMGPIFLYTLRDLDLGPDDRESHFGLYSEDGKKKESAKMLGDMLADCSGS